MDERDTRIALNESLFREVNEAVSGISDRFDSESFEIVCECGDSACTERIHLTREEYEAVRQEPDRFAVRAGHEIPDVERVVADHDEYVLVEKEGPGATSLAESTDPRSSS